MARLLDIEGIGSTYAQKLKEAGIETVDELLAKGASAKGRDTLAGQTGITTTLLLEWVNHADLFRIQGIAGEYSDLLEEAGVDSVPELATRNPQNLHQKLTEINEQKQLVRQLPSAAQVSGWVEQAKKLPRVVTFRRRVSPEHVGERRGCRLAHPPDRSLRIGVQVESRPAVSGGSLAYERARGALAPGVREEGKPFASPGRPPGAHRGGT
jgi:predicted flap endonuclease-1-like 5' DNA nuclease